MRTHDLAKRATVVLRAPRPADFDAAVAALLARAAAESGTSIEEIRVLNRIPRAGAVVVEAPAAAFALLASMSEVASVSGEDGPSAFIPPVKVVVDED